MLRISLFTAAMLIAGVVHAQINADTQAAAPVVYSDAPASAPGCDSDVRNADGSPVISCVADAQRQEDDADEEGGAYPPDYAYDTLDYDTGVYAPNFYLGVSLLPYDYWPVGYGFGWPYYGYATFGYGWPYLGFAAYWGGGFWGGHHGWHGHHGHDGHHGHHGHDYHGPYRYVGHGRYWDQTRQASTFNHRVAGAAFNTRANSMAGNRNYTGNPGVLANRASAPTNMSRIGPSTNTAMSARAGQRAVLPSASYYAAAQSTLRARSMPVTASPMSRGGNSRAASQAYRVTSLPPRNTYPVAARVGSGYRNTYSGAARSGYSVAHGSYAAVPRGGYSLPQRYSMPARGYASPRSTPAFSRGGAGYATHSAGASPVHSSAGSSHVASGISRSHR